MKAFAAITQPYGTGSTPLPFRQAEQVIQARFMLNLAKAGFPISDAKLVSAAGSCKPCPKRTGNQPEVFAGIDADVCTDPDC